MTRKTFPLFVGSIILSLILPSFAHAGGPSAPSVKHAPISTHTHAKGHCQKQNGVTLCGAKPAQAALLGAHAPSHADRKKILVVKINTRRLKRNFTQGFFADRVPGPKPWSAH